MAANSQRNWGVTRMNLCMDAHTPFVRAVLAGPDQSELVVQPELPKKYEQMTVKELKDFIQQTARNLAP